MIQTYYSLPGQSLYDICENTYGTLEYVVKLAQDNGLTTFKYYPNPGTPFLWDDSLIFNQAPNQPKYTYATAYGPIGDILDNYPGAIAGYSLRRLYRSYGGYAIRIRRSSDNAEKDIGFNFDGSLNLTDFAAFVGAGIAYVTTFYDQTGNGLHWKQTTASLQPKTDGKSIIFPSTGTAGSVFYLDQGNIFGNSAPIGTYYHTFMVAQNNPPLSGAWSFKNLIDYDSDQGSLSKGWGIRLGNLNSNINNMQIWNTGGKLERFYCNSSPYTMNQVAIPNNTGLRVYDLLVNGFTTNGAHKFRIGGHAAGYEVTDSSWNGLIKEIIIYNANMSARRLDISNYIRSYYGI